MTHMGDGRSEGDSWDLTSSVGATATLVAAGRAVASRGPDAMVDDPFAEPLVRAVGIDVCTRFAAGELDPRGLADNTTKNMRAWIDWIAVRTRYFDDFFGDAARDGIRQAVIVASGLDTRAYRLPWPSGTTVYEIDQPQVLGFKSATLARLGAQPAAYRRVVAIDLRNDWPAALRQAGFDPTRPTAWIAEGLLGYLPDDAQGRLLDRIAELSVAGSRFGTHWRPDVHGLDETGLRQQMRNRSRWWRDLGFDLDISELMYFYGDRTDVAADFAARGWETVARTATDLLASYGLPPIEDAAFGEVVYLRAELN